MLTDAASAELSLRLALSFSNSGGKKTTSRLTNGLLIYPHNRLVFFSAIQTHRSERETPETSCICSKQPTTVIRRNKSLALPESELPRQTIRLATAVRRVRGADFYWAAKK